MKLQSLIKKTITKLADYAESKGNRHVIIGGPDDTTPYLVRYILFKSKLGSIYIHRFMRSDADAPHDHPWNFFTYIVSGEYTERFYDRSEPQMTIQEFHNFSDREIFTDLWTLKVNRRKTGSLAFRRATDTHVVKLDRSYSMEEIDQAPLTVCLLGPRIREWGFWNICDGQNINGSIWTDWRQYLGITPDDSRIEGSE